MVEPPQPERGPTLFGLPMSERDFPARSARTPGFPGNPHFIYALHAGDCNYRYIGTSRNPYMRFAVHRSNIASGNGNARLYDWARSIGVESLAMDIIDGPILTMPETVEREWCQFFHLQGYDLLNLNPESPSGWSKRGHHDTNRGPHTRWHVNRDYVDPDCEFCLVLSK